MTQKPISTISYNSESFLLEKLNQWYNAHWIQAYQCIRHKGEDGDKDHFHVRIEPNKSLDPMCLTSELKEFEIGKDKPLGVRPWRFSREEDWYLYVTHDEEYLRLKYGGFEPGEKIPYEYTQIIISPDYDIEIAWIRAQQAKLHCAGAVVKRIREGEQPVNMVLKGENLFLVKAALGVLQTTDYQRIQAELFTLDANVKDLISELDKIYHIKIDLDKNGKFTIRK